MGKIFVGSFLLNEEVDVTDPCYDDDVWCRETVPCEKGEYDAYVYMQDCDDWGERVAKLRIVKRGTKIGKINLFQSSEIGVDSGLCGFFNKKKNYKTHAEWREFCDKIGNKDYILLDNGIVCSSGYGDGMYELLSNENNTAFEVRFL